MKPDNRKHLGRTINTEPTMTDQSQAHEADLNVIVGKFGIGGTAPGNAASPMYGDFTNLPDDLRGFIDRSRELQQHRDALPEQLRSIPLEELLQMDGRAIADKLKPANPPAQTEEKK